MTEKCSTPPWTNHLANKALTLELHQRKSRNYNKSNSQLRGRKTPSEMSADSTSTSSDRTLWLNVVLPVVMTSNKEGSWTFLVAISKASKCSSHTWSIQLEPWLKITISREENKLTKMVRRRMPIHLEVRLLTPASLVEFSRGRRALFWSVKLNINLDQLQALQLTTSPLTMDISNSQGCSNRTSQGVNSKEGQVSTLTLTTCLKEQGHQWRHLVRKWGNQSNQFLIYTSKAHQGRHLWGIERLILTYRRLSRALICPAYWRRSSEPKRGLTCWKWNRRQLLHLTRNFRGAGIRTRSITFRNSSINKLPGKRKLTTSVTVTAIIRSINSTSNHLLKYWRHMNESWWTWQHLTSRFIASL